MLLPTQRPAKRQSFAIESLAISSHAEDATRRDTASPYLSYLEQSAESRTRDLNANPVSLQKQLPFLEPQVKCANFIVNQQMDAVSAAGHGYGITMSYADTLATSTPKVTSCKRQRLCSASTPPSSDESTTGEEKMVTDNSGVMDIKLSPGSGSASIASDASTMVFFMEMSAETSIIPHQTS